MNDPKKDWTPSGSEERRPLVTLTTPRGKPVFLERRNSVAVAVLAEDLAKSGRPEGYSFVSDLLQDKRVGGKVLLRKKEDVLSLSLLLRPPMHVKRSGIITMLATVAACRVFENNSPTKPTIEWNREIWAGDKKLGAFAFNGSLLPSGFWNYLVLHAAFSIDPESFTDSLSDVVQRIFSNRTADIGDRVAEGFLTEFFAMYETCSTDNSFCEEYNKRIGFKGKRVRARYKGEPIYGKIEGISDGGQVLLRIKGGEVISLQASEVNRTTL